MKYKIPILILFVLILTPFVIAHKVDLYLFYTNGCPHCRAERQFLDSIKPNYPDLTIHELEISNRENVVLFSRMCEAYNTKPMGVPMTFIGDDYLTGFGGPSIVQLENKIKSCVQTKCTNPGVKIGLTEEQIITKEEAIEISKTNNLIQQILQENPNSTPEIKDDYDYIVSWKSEKKQAAVYVNKTSGEIIQVLQQGFNIMESNATSDHISLNEPDEAINESIVELPVFGEVNLSKIGLPLFTVIIESI